MFFLHQLVSHRRAGCDGIIRIANARRGEHKHVTVTDLTRFGDDTIVMTAVSPSTQRVQKRFTEDFLMCQGFERKSELSPKPRCPSKELGVPPEVGSFKQKLSPEVGSFKPKLSFDVGPFKPKPNRSEM